MSSTAPTHSATAASPFQIDAVVMDRVTFALFANGDKLVREVSVTNRGESAIAGGKIVVELQRPGSQAVEFPLGRLEPEATVTVAPSLGLPLASLASQTEAEMTAVSVRVETEAGNFERTFPVEVTPFDHWPGASVPLETLTSFITPNHERVAELLIVAGPELERLTGKSAFDGYQSKSRQRAVDIAHACACAVQGLGLGYAEPPPSFERTGQRVRFADRVLRDRLGSCLDLSLLLSSMWEYAGLRPLLVLTEGHAFCGFWTKPALLTEPVHDDPAQVRNLVKLGDVVCYESTLIIQKGTSQADWVRAAAEKLEHPGSFFACVDVASARRNGARPIPLRNAGDVQEIDLTSVTASESEMKPLDAIVTAERESGFPVTNRGADLPSRRVAEWQMKLLDLTLHNRLINLRKTSKTLELNIPDLTAFADGLWKEQRFTVKPQVTGDASVLLEHLADGLIHTQQSPSETNQALLSLYREHRVAIEESGSNPLFVTLGQLRWYESDASEQPRLAPLLLLPIQLIRHGEGGGYRYEIEMTDESVRVNITLLEKLRTDFGLDVELLSVVPESDAGIDVPVLLRRAREVIRSMKRWEILDASMVGMFSFSKFLMWKDLQENLATLRQNRLVNHLLERPGEDLPNPPFVNAETIDDEVPADDLFCTREADSSQIAAVRSASQGVTFVLEGPPGTGKSQTISNIIADSIARGKRVLFVAEKMAALTVVRDRLEQDGLGAFCLELHSAKASKREVLAQLERAMGASSPSISDRWKKECANLTKERDALNTYVRELHKLRGSGETLHQVLGRLAHIGDGPEAVPEVKNLGSISSDNLVSLRSLIRELTTMAAPVDPVREHPLREVGRRQFSMTLREDVRSATDQATVAIGNLRVSTQTLLRVFESQLQIEDLSKHMLETLAQCVDLIDNSTPMPVSLTASDDSASNIAACRAFVSIAREADIDRAQLLRRYRNELLEIDVLDLLSQVRTASAQKGIFSFFGRRAAKTRLRPYCLEQPPSLADAVRDLELAAALRRKVVDLQSRQFARSCLELATSRRSWDEIDESINRCERLQKIIATNSRDSKTLSLLQTFARIAADQGSRLALLDAARNFDSAWRHWVQVWSRINDLLVVDSCDQGTVAQLPGWFDSSKSRLARWKAGANFLKDWCAWQEVRARAAEAGLSTLLDLHESGTSRTSLSDIFERGYGRVWFNEVAQTIPAIRDFTEHSHTARIQRFRQQDHQIISLAPLAVAGRVTAQWPSSNTDAASKSELGILRNELQKKTKLLPPRRLLREAPNLIARLKPCFLMSPLSVAQYLDAKLPPFDLVVFDEASQIPVWDSIGALARGLNAIVVGDSKQLPPTNFFNVSMSSDDNEPEIDDDASEEMESILKKCLASGVPSMWLKWHYRSKHESLIAFSNHHYYKNQLNTFPSPADRSPTLGVTFRHVPEGVYDRGGSRTNRLEAQQVVDEVVTQLTRSAGSSSLGIVTFNQAQQSLIEDLLDAKRRELPELDRHFTQEREPVFVKNLENVQGDERDTIIFSIGYGRDAAGKCSLNFGPVNQDGGERRLNVAVTRARRNLIVFSGITADDLDPRKTRSIGLAHLRRYLDYAQRGPRAIAEALIVSRDDSFDSGFEQAVCAALRARGWQVDTQVGCAGYRIDLGVRHPDKPGKYVVGIECDGAAYHSAKSARDRDKLREAVLTSLGWSIQRVWSTDWWESPDRCIDRLHSAIEKAIAQHAMSIEVAPKPPTQPHLFARKVDLQLKNVSKARTPSNALSGLATYRSSKSPLNRPLDVYRSSNDALTCLLHLLRKEGPVVDELIVNRLATWSQMQRVTEKFKNSVADCIQLAIDLGKACRVEDAIVIAEMIDSSFPVRLQAANDIDSRNLSEVPLVELASGVIHVVRTQFGLPLDSLADEVGGLFGARRLTQADRIRLMNALTIASKRGEVRVSGDRVLVSS